MKCKVVSDVLSYPFLDICDADYAFEVENHSHRPFALVAEYSQKNNLFIIAQCLLFQHKDSFRLGEPFRTQIVQMSVIKSTVARG